MSQSTVTVTITVRAPNGATEQLAVEEKENAERVTREAVDQFRREKQIAEGAYDLALARAGQTATIIPPGQRLNELTFDPKVDVFLLINKKPQVDG